MPASAQKADECVSSVQEIEKEFIWTISNKESTLIDVIVWHQDVWSEKGKLIEYFCDTRFLEHKKFTWLDGVKREVPNMKHQCADIEEWMRIDPRQSFFMYGLCVGYDDAMRKSGKILYRGRDWKKDFTNLKYVHEDWWKDVSVNIEKFIPDEVKENILTERWWLEEKWDVCEPKTWMNNCMIWYPSTNIVYNVFSALFDIKKAAIDGYDHWKKQNDIDESIKDLSRSLFNIFDDWTWKKTQWVCLDTGKTFISDLDSPSDNATSHCRHPQTRGFISWMISWAIQNVDQVSKIDGHEIMKEECLDLRSTMAACAMSNVVTLSEPAWAIWAENSIFWSEEWAWRNMVENELFFVSLWRDYYETVVLNNTKYQWSEQWGDLADKIRRTEMEVASFTKELDLITSAADLMMNLLDQYRMMYHQCIALNAYQEDLHYFWQRVNKMYTPLHQILYITQDAQEKDENEKYD